MRELKFRIWNTADKSFLDTTPGEWGYYYITTDGKFMVHYNKVGLGDNPFCKAKEVNLTYMVIQLYSEAKDKNGKEIYEGDIIRYQGRVGRIEFFATMFVCSWDDQTDNELAYMTINDIEVIGNIFEKN